jgi:two-component system cell cycle response regulator
MAMDMNVPVKLAENIYWVGSTDDAGLLQCHSYLILDGEEAVLIDPGSPINFDTIYQKIISLIPIKKIRYIIMTHQDPDVCSSVPMFEQKGFEGELATHWRTSVITRFYGTKSQYYMVDQNQYQLSFGSGRILNFIATPYLHFPGAIMVYDEKSKILFSSDLFGALSTERELWATKYYFESMMAFHEHYMPSNEILRPIMELLLNLEISIIAPQHGSIINKKIKEAIVTLRDLECGIYLHPIKKELINTGGYSGLCNQILKRFYSVFENKEIQEIFDGSQIILDPDSGTIADFNLPGYDLWDAFFELVYLKKGITWIALVEPLVHKKAIEYDITLPEIYKTAFIDIETKLDNLSSQNIHLKELNDRLNANLKDTQDILQRCPITKLYKEIFFNEYLKKDLQSVHGKDEKIALLIVEIDKMSTTIFDYGQNAGDEVLKSTAYLLEKMKTPQQSLFRLDGPQFAIYLPATDRNHAVDFADKMRSTISQSQVFLHPTTVSIGVSFLDEFSNLSLSEEELAEYLIKVAKLRLQIAKNRGMNIICYESDFLNYSENVGTVLVIEPDELNANIIETALTSLKINVVLCIDGLQAIEMIEKEEPDMILSEIFLPKIDGLVLREKMLQSSSQKNIPFIIMSHKKDEKSVQRANQLEILHYLKKPFMLSELVGLVQNLLA